MMKLLQIYDSITPLTAAKSISATHLYAIASANGHSQAKINNYSTHACPAFGRPSNLV